MQITNLTPDRLTDFPVQLPVLRRMFARGQSRPDWCYLALEKGVPVAAVGFGGEVDDPRIVNVFAINGTSERLVALFEKGLPSMQEQGVKAILVETGEAETSTGCLWAGFTKIQERQYWRWESPWPSVTEPEGFLFRSMEESGEAAFVDALAMLFDRTLDPYLRLQSEVWGSSRAAEKTIEDLKTRNTHFHWWHVCFSPEGTPFGLVCPYLDAPRIGTFGLLSTIPRQDDGRLGQTSPPPAELPGTRSALLAKGTALLQSRGVDEIFYAASPEWDLTFRRTGCYRRAGRVQILKYVFGNSNDLY